jgi:proteasome lid subunit RPN8/RPN11
MSETPVSLPIAAEFESSALQRIRQHARSSMNAEICGVLIGRAIDGVTQVEACIPGEGAAQGGAHVTFTQDAWEHIYKIKDAEFPEQSIVGWYHSHPGFGVFLSDYDLFIHENFFGASHQLAWVFDPHSDEEGCFGWAGKKIVPLSRVAVRQRLNEGGAPPKEEESTRKKPAPRREKKESMGWLKRSGEMAMLLGGGFVMGVLVGPWIKRPIDHPLQNTPLSAQASVVTPPATKSASAPPASPPPLKTIFLDSPAPTQSVNPLPTPEETGKQTSGPAPMPAIDPKPPPLHLQN